MKNLLLLALLLMPSLNWAAPIQITPIGATVTNGTTITIKWVPPVGMHTVRIQLQTDLYHGAYIDEFATNSGQYTWKVGQIYDYNYYRSFYILIDAFSGGTYASGSTAYFTVVDDPAALPVIIAPTTNQVVYVGDNLEIRWKTLIPGHGSSNVLIKVAGNIGGLYFSQLVPNTGSYTWTNVSKSGAGQEGFTMYIADEAYVTNRSSVPIRIPNAPRPRPVPITIRKVVSVEWVSIPGHTYQVEKSTDLKNWVLVAEGQAEDTNSLALFYAESPQEFFRVFDPNP